MSPLRSLSSRVSDYQKVPPTQLCYKSPRAPKLPPTENSSHLILDTFFTLLHVMKFTVFVCVASCHWPKTQTKTSYFYVIFNFKISKFLYINVWTISYMERSQWNVAQISLLIRLLAPILTTVRRSFRPFT